MLPPDDHSPDDHNPEDHTQDPLSAGDLASGAEMDAEEEAILDLFEDYQAGFNDFDADQISDCFALPVIIWQLGKGHIFKDEDELVENTEALLSALDKEGVVQSDYEVVSLSISGSTALATLNWRQEEADGSAVFEFTCHYHLIKDGEDWTIAMVVNG